MKERVRPRRSALYVPGDKPRAIDKAAAVPADVVIFDLEDSVAQEAKRAAHAAVVAALASRRYGSRELILRINGLDSGLAEADCAVAADTQPQAVLVPKVDSATDIARAQALLSKGGARGMRIWAMIETPAAVLNAAEIANAPGVTCLVAGLNDLAAALHARIRPGRAALAPHLAAIVAAARAHGRAVLDGTFNDVRDAAGFRAECGEARDMGFDGKTLIHPDQVADANAAFAPSDDEIAWARAVVEAFARPENAGKGVIAIGGRMAERLHERAARDTLAIAEAIGAMESGGR
jgi:citrate lyase subunit beta/citryl-CoA lyase